MASLACPECGSVTIVLDGRSVKDDRNKFRRRRLCNECGYKFTTYEDNSPFSKLSEKEQKLIEDYRKGFCVLVFETNDRRKLKPVRDASDKEYIKYVGYSI